MSNEYEIPDVQLRKQEKATQELMEQYRKVNKATEESKQMENIMENNDTTALLKIVGDMGELKGQLTEGFKAVHQRLDTLNGRTGKAEGKIDLIEQQQARADSRMVTLGWVFGATTTIIGLLIAAIGVYVAFVK